ncbi:MAG TPA: zinc-dependent metalloprotease, partial [Polyangia bacterium]
RAIYTKDYLDVTLQVQAVPDYYACAKLFADPDDVGVSTCGPASIKVRESFMAVQPTEYEPLEYPDQDPLLDANGQPISIFWTSTGPKPCNSTNLSNGGGSYSGADCTKAGADKFAKFGFFRTVRQSYDPKYGSTEAGRTYYANRWNIWQKTLQRDANGNPIPDGSGGFLRMPDEARVPRVIPYYTNVEFPDDDPMLWTTAQEVVADWNDAMKRTVAGIKDTVATTQVPEAQIIADAANVPDIFVLKRNSCNVTDVTAFVAAHTDLADQLKTVAGVDTTTIDKTNLVQTCSALEALTQTLADGDAKKFSWQRDGDLRYSFIFWVDRPQGAASAPLGFGPTSTDPETGEIISGATYLYGAALNTYAQFAADSVDILNGNLSTDDLLSGKRITDIMKETEADRTVRDAFTLTPEARSYAHAQATAGMLPAPAAATGADFTSSVLPRLVKIDPVAADLKLATIKGTPLEAQLMTDDILTAFVPNYIPGRTKPSDIDPATLAQASPVNWLSQAASQTKRDRNQTLAINGCLLTSDFADDAILGTALKLANLTGDALYKTLRASIFRGLVDHEMGHTMGLRHNFAGSTDALNYGKDYWTIRTSVDKSLWAQNSLEEHQYSTVMDYGSRFNTDVAGLGRYDYAAIRFGYGKLMDTMPNAADAGGQLKYDIFIGDYTTIPTMVGGTAMVDDTAVMRYSVAEQALRTGYQNLATNGGSFGIYPERPYKFCSDEFEGNLDCKTWDMGANQQEIVNNTIDLYKNYYVFNAYQRGRVGWDINGYLDRLTGRYFNRYSQAFEFYYFYNGYFNGSYIADDLLAAAMLAMNALGDVLQTPEPGPHCATDMNPNVLTVSNGVGDSTCHNDSPQPNIELPDAKPYYISFSDDYYYRITRAGSLYEKLAALISLMNTSSSFFRVDESAVQDLYSIGYYRVFKNQLLNLLSGVIRDDPSTYGGYAPNGVYTPTPVVDPATFGKVSFPTPPYMLPTTKRVDTPDTKTIEYYALLLGMAQLNSTWDSTLDFSNYVNVTLKGSNDDATYAPGTPVVEFTHPTSHLVYRAAQVDPANPGIGVTLLQEMNAIVGVSGTPGTLLPKYGMVNGQPLPDWYTSKANLDAAQAAGDQNAYSDALIIFNYVDSLLGLRSDVMGDLRTFRRAFSN